MRLALLGLAALATILLLSPVSAQTIIVSPNVTFQAGDLTINWNAAASLSSIVVRNGSISFNGHELGASDSVNVTIQSWRAAGSEASRSEFSFLANSTPSTSVNFSLVTTETVSTWLVKVDGERYDEGDNETITFEISDWQSGVNRYVLLIVNFVGTREAWLITYGSAWVALLVGGGIMVLIFSSFYVGIKKRKKQRTGKIWRYMPRKWR